MIQNYFKLNFRALWKNRSHTAINMIGLALGITSALILFLVVRFELSFDNYHADADRIYRVVTERSRYDKLDYTAGVTYPLPDAMRQDFPDIELITVTDSNEGDPVIGIPHRDGSVDRFKEKLVTFADPDYFSIFSYNWIEGNPSALAQEKTVVLTESIAKKYFGDESALGKVITFNSKYDLKVSGVVSDPPLNSDLPFTIIISNLLGADKHAWDNWDSSSSSVNAYLKLKEGVSVDDFNNKLKGWHMKYFTGEDEEAGRSQNYFLQPLSQVHYDTRFTNYNNRVISMPNILALLFIGVLLLITACINFVNLNTVLIVNRAKEVGVRKVMGSSRKALVFQFLGETFFITILALIVSMGLVELALLNLQPLLGYKLEFQPLADGLTALIVFTLPILVTLVAGVYPALSLASFQPIKALRNKTMTGNGEGIGLRRTLIGVQLIISQALVICTIIAVEQINLFRTMPMGLDSSSIIEFELPENKNVDLKTLKERLQRINGVENVNMNNTGSVSENAWGGDLNAIVNGEKVTRDCMVKFADEDYLETYRLKLVAGEDLVKSDTANRFLINEALANELGFSTPEAAIGTPVEFWGRKALVWGVVKNYNTTSLREGILPTIIMTGEKAYQLCGVKLQTSNLKDAIAAIESTWNQTFPNYVFEYQFLDDTIRNFYKDEERTSRLMTLFSGVAILIGCIGLFGLVSFMVSKKTKEVGIRKTLGASVGNIMLLFSKEFLILIFISFAIAAPLSWYVMQQWLGNFAYRIDPGLLTFVAGVALSVVVVLATVSYKSYRAAIANPIESLRDE